jgi:hypothetical protein
MNKSPKKLQRNSLKKKGGGDADLDLIGETLRTIYARMNLDLDSKVSHLEKFCMI